MELFPIVLATAVWGKHWTELNVIAHCDNMGTVAVVNSGYSKAAPVMHLLANISTALLVTNITSLLLHNSRNVWNSVINFTLKSCSTWVKELHKVVGIFSGFIETVELCSETVEILWAINILRTTSGINNSQQAMLHFLFHQENCTIALKPHIYLKFITLLFTTCQYH